MQLERRVLTRYAIESFRVKSLATNSPKHVGEMLLHERYLGLDGELNVFQARLWTTIRSDTSEYPAAAFLIHQTARAIDWIHDNAPNNIRLCGAARNNYLSVT